ncbi:prepilin-type N-terminal cleavage/methylation domain-containing protein [Planomicrobium sp. HSC-17F08]|nr:prepilin-type N-terminal cleavage/methylation domain-containing protein [Planomicrobium sp. HSC-17F08]
MKKLIKNEQGLTLVEILATLVLLGIVFVGIMSVFSQMTLFNDKTYTKLETMNLARQEMAEMKAIDFTKSLVLSELTSSPANYIKQSAALQKDSINNTFYLFTKNKDDYTYELRFYNVPKLSGESRAGELHQVHLIVRTGTKINSETYGYIEIN